MGEVGGGCPADFGFACVPQRHRTLTDSSVGGGHIGIRTAPVGVNGSNLNTLESVLLVSFLIQLWPKQEQDPFNIFRPETNECTSGYHDLSFDRNNYDLTHARKQCELRKQVSFYWFKHNLFSYIFVTIH